MSYVNVGSIRARAARVIIAGNRASIRVDAIDSVALGLDGRSVWVLLKDGRSRCIDRSPVDEATRVYWLCVNEWARHLLAEVQS